MSPWWLVLFVQSSLPCYFHVFEFFVDLQKACLWRDFQIHKIPEQPSFQTEMMTSRWRMWEVIGGLHLISNKLLHHRAGPALGRLLAATGWDLQAWPGKQRLSQCHTGPTAMRGWGNGVELGRNLTQLLSLFERQIKYFHLVDSLFLKPFTTVFQSKTCGKIKENGILAFWISVRRFKWPDTLSLLCWSVSAKEHHTVCYFLKNILLFLRNMQGGSGHFPYLCICLFSNHCYR